MKTFTFPDGHLSFEYRGDWSVNTIEEPSRPGAAKSGPVEAIISDADGNRVISIVSGSAADDAAGEPVTRSILDMEPVMALQAADGETPVLGLAVDTDADGKITTHFDVRGVTDFVSETGTSGTNRVKLGNGFMAATAILPDRGQIFKTESAARDWTASEGYRHTRALFLSLKYT